MDLYNGEKKVDFKSPNIVRAYYANEDKINVVLEFDQNIFLPTDTLVIDKNGKKYIRKLQENFSFSPHCGMNEELLHERARNPRPTPSP